jgi:CRISPR-associated protein Csd1
VILTALKELAEREGLVNDPDYEPREVSYLVHISRDGRITRFTSTLSPPASGRGKPRPKKLRVPRHSGRTKGSVAEFLCDKAEYVFGFDPAGKRNVTDLAKRRALFLDKVKACAEATHDDAIQCLLKALTPVHGGDDASRLYDLASNSLFAFVFDPDGEMLISDRPAVRKYWQDIRDHQANNGEGLAESTCLITGEPCQPTDKHPSVKRVPGANTSGAALVSFSASAFESYGLVRNDNAPIGRAAAEAYTTALNRLLDPAYPNPVDGTALPRRNVRLNDTTVAVFWSREDSPFVDLFADVLAAHAAAIRALLGAPYTGRQPVLDDPQAFYAAVLSGAQGRIILREWIETSVREVVRNVGQHFDDFTIVRPHVGALPQPLWLLLRSMAVLGKEDNIPPSLAAQFFATILRGGLYPRALLDASLRRMHADQSVPPVRAALIKGYLSRARRFGRLAPHFPEVTVSLDESSSSVPYRLGRLFAVLERLQEVAVRPSATIRDRFFGAASANPVTVFPRLLRGAQPHISKIRNGSYFQKLIGEIADGLPARSFPAALTIEEQGLFALGYYHQRQALFTKGAAVAGQTEVPHFQ